MNFNVEDIEKQFNEQTRNLENIEAKLKESYEERILINEIREFIQQNRNLEAEIEECNKKIVQINSYNFNDLKNEKKSAIENLRKLKQYQKYLGEHKNDDIPKNELIQQLKVENIKRTNDYLIQKNDIVLITRNLIDICEESITDLKHKNGKSVDLSKLFSEFETVEENIKSFDKYNNILSRKNELELEQLKMQKKCIIEQLRDKLPDFGKMIVDSVKQNMYEEERERVSKEKQENNNKIEKLTELNKKLEEFDKELRKNKFSELTKKIWEQEKNIVRIKMNIETAEKGKMSEIIQKNNLPEEKAVENEKKTNELVRKFTENKQEQNTKHLNEFKANEANNFERMNVKDFIEQKNNTIQQDNKKEKTQETLLSPEIIAQMDAVVKEANKEEPIKNNIQQNKKLTNEMITNEEVQKYLFDGEDTITPELPNKYAEVIERVRQKEKQQEDKKESTIQIKRKAELENIKKFLKTQEQKSEDEIAKKIKRKTLKQKFTELGKKVLNKIGDFLLNEEIFEEENALLEESIYEKQGRSK